MKLLDIDGPLYPMRVYVYDEDGRYGDPLTVESETELYALKATLRDAMKRKMEIRITDPLDFLLFHAKGGEILFDGQNIKEEN
jgi:hypothetical protein